MKTLIPIPQFTSHSPVQMTSINGSATQTMTSQQYAANPFGNNNYTKSLYSAHQA